MLHIERDRQFLIFPSWLHIAYSWADIPDMIKDPIEHDLLARFNYTRADLESFGYSFDVPVDILDGPCGGGGGVLVPHLPQRKRWVVNGALTFDKGADIRSPRYFEYYGDEFCYGLLNVSHLEHRAHAGSMYRFDRPPKNPMLLCSVEHVEFLTDQVYWLVTGRAPANSEMLHRLPEWAEAFDLKLELLSSTDTGLEDFVRTWVPEKLKTVLFSVRSNNQGMGFHFAVLMYFAFHLGATEKRRIKSIHLLANIEAQPRLFSVDMRRLE